jgi:hypothetical protein
MVTKVDPAQSFKEKHGYANVYVVNMQQNYKMNIFECNKCGKPTRENV